MPDRALLDELTAAVVSWFTERADPFGLKPEAIEARYILNWGGFVNASFTITDGETRFHLKLADDEWAKMGLERWRALNDWLSQNYHAPRMVEWLEIPGTEFSGPLFEFIPGKPLDLVGQSGLRQEILDLIGRLHNDTGLAELLAEEDDENPSCADFFLDLYIDRFDEDLRIIAADLPPFVSLKLLDWMMGETRELEGLVRDLPSFSVPACSPTHGDLWSNNILVTSDERWYIIDWDDLTLGDPALEYAIFLGPLWRRHILTQEQVEAFLPPDQALRERFGVCLRAFLLDEVIDPLADWVEATFAPEFLDQVRAEKEKQHREAFALYQKIY